MSEKENLIHRALRGTSTRRVLRHSATTKVTLRRPTARLFFRPRFRTAGTYCARPSFAVRGWQIRGDCKLVLRNVIAVALQSMDEKRMALGDDRRVSPSQVNRLLRGAEIAECDHRAAHRRLGVVGKSISRKDGAPMGATVR
ncbi:MAG: hypothetical protein IT492_18365 [Gammaproteobacteria bacterium]|nr:hypothetical protein [Gammaproteobacteria bacterium]